MVAAFVGLVLSIFSPEEGPSLAFMATKRFVREFVVTTLTGFPLFLLVFSLEWRWYERRLRDAKHAAETESKGK